MYDDDDYRSGSRPMYSQPPLSRTSSRISRRRPSSIFVHRRESRTERPVVVELAMAMDHAKISPTLTHNFLLQIQDLNFSSHIGSVSQRDDHGDTNTTWRDYSLGDIINIPHVIPSLDPNANLGNLHFVNSLKTGAVVAKRRPAVIVAMYWKYMICIPLYTSQGRGFESQDESIRDDCLRVRDPGDDRPMWIEYDKSQYLVTSPSLEMRDESYLNLTQSYPIWYGYPLSWMGRLSQESTVYLIEAWLHSIRKGLLPIEDQVDCYPGYEHETPLMQSEFEKDEYSQVPCSGGCESTEEVLGQGEIAE